MEWTEPRNSLCRVCRIATQKEQKESLVQDIHRILCVILLRYGGALQTLLPRRRLTSCTHQTPAPAPLLPYSSPSLPSLTPTPPPTFLPAVPPAFPNPRPRVGKCEPKYQHKILNKRAFSLGCWGPHAGKAQSS